MPQSEGIEIRAVERAERARNVIRTPPLCSLKGELLHGCDPSAPPPPTGKGCELAGVLGLLEGSSGVAVPTEQNIEGARLQPEVTRRSTIVDEERWERQDALDEPR